MFRISDLDIRLYLAAFGSGFARWGFAAAVLLCFWTLLIYQLGAQWTIYEQYHYGWAVPGLCLYLLWRRVTTPEEGASPVLRLPSSVLRPPSSVLSPRPSVLLCTFFAALYAPTRVLHEANPIWRATSWALALEIVALTLCLLYVLIASTPSRSNPAALVHHPPIQPSNHPPIQSRVIPPLPRSTPATPSRSHAPTLLRSPRAFAFPVCFFLVAVPWPTPVEQFIVQEFTRLNITASVEALDLLGIPAIAQGNAIEVGTGSVGLDEACSGIRSLQITLMLSLLFGELQRLSAGRRVLLCLVSFLLAFVSNVARVTLLAAVGSQKGIATMTHWHDLTGTLILFACFGLIFTVSLLLRTRKRAESRQLRADRSKPNGPAVVSSPNPIIQPSTNPTAPESTASKLRCSKAGASSTNPTIQISTNPIIQISTHPTTRPSATPTLLRSNALTLRRLSLSLFAWFFAVELGTEASFQLHERTLPTSSDFSIRWPRENPSFEPLQHREDVARALQFDHAESGRWSEPDGTQWLVHDLQWVPNGWLYHRVKIGLSKSHRPEICLRAWGMTLRSELEALQIGCRGGQSLHFRQYLFESEGQLVHVFFAGEEFPRRRTVPGYFRATHWERVKAALAGSRNYGQRTLEIALWGVEDPAQAGERLKQELQELVEAGA